MILYNLKTGVYEYKFISIIPLSFLTKESGNHSLFLSLFQPASPMWNNYPSKKDFTQKKKEKYSALGNLRMNFII